MIAVVILRPTDPQTLEIDTWLMSCRILGRRMEEATLFHIVAAGHRLGATTITGTYLPSAKNRMVADHYGKLGFTLVVVGEDGSSRWRLELADYAPPALPMRFTGPSAV
jgi:predicted enzyme involved in methoxymalonyl-ACP biosynthesis